MATIAEGWAGTGGGLLLGNQRRKLEESVQSLYRAYLEGPFVLPPDQLLAQLKEQDAALLTDLVHQLYWEHLGTPGYTQDISAERTRAIDESRRLWKYNPLAQWMIWLWTNYGFGENIVIIPEDEDAIKTWEEFWKADRNQSVLAQDKIADKLSNWLLVDGDRFLAFYASTLDGEATIRRINTKEIVEVVTDPDDSSVPLFYKRQWTNTKNQQLTWYYPDWGAFFRGDLDRAKLPRDAIRADEQDDNTVVCILHVAFNGKDEDSLYGWPLLAAGSPWIRSQKRHLENRLAVSAAKAMYVRKATVKGGSRAVNAVISNIQSALSSTQGYETNPPAVAGSTLVENQAVTTADMPMTTGASDAKTDGEMFSWMAGLSGGVFPHYMGLGDAYRLATATSMEKPLEMQFSRYQVFWSAQFRKMVRIVLQFDEKYGDATYQTYEAEVSTDKMVEVDLDGMSQALGRVFTTIINPQVTLGKLPDEVTQGMLKASLKTILQALGVDAETVLGDEEWEVVGEEGELEESIALALQNYRDGLIDADDLVAFLVPSRLEEGGPGSGHWGHAGRPGKVGGSSPGEGKEKKRDERRAGKAPKGKDTTTEDMNTFLNKGLFPERMPGVGATAGTTLWKGAPDEVRAKAKAEVVSTLAEKTDIPEEDVNAFVGQWAQSSNDDDMRSLAIQQDAAKEFGIEQSEFTQTRISKIEQRREKLIDRWRKAGHDEEDIAELLGDSPKFNSLMESSKQRALVQAMYENTQEKLSAAGFKPEDTIRLRRGVRLPRSEMIDWKEGDIKSIRGNVLESWSIEENAARSFATGGGFENRGVVFEMDVPISLIIGSARTGFGCLLEGEFVTVGAGGEAKIIFLTGE